MMPKTLLLMALFLPPFIWAQEEFPKNYFRSPVDTIIVLAGNFAELRPNHFHGGLDIKTGNKERMPIHAVADGYVSRIKVSSFGYGRVIYITHPNGFVSVYAHNSSFNDAIGTYVKDRQYLQMRFEIELFPKPGELPVKQGEVISLSGNTGQSSGPHLHFEIRDEKTEKAINPLLFGLPVKDNVKPQLTKIKIYPADENGTVNGSGKSVECAVKAGKGGYVLAIADTLVLSGNIYFGLEGYDSETHRAGKNGLYSIELQLNNSRIFYCEMNKIGFDETRCMNTYIDYPAYIKAGKFIHRSYVEQNNKLGIYKDVINKGVVEFNSENIYHLKYTVKDIFGNSVMLSFPVKSKRNNTTSIKAPDKNTYATVFHCREENKFNRDDLEINMPANILYDDIYFKYSVSKSKLPDCYSEIYHVHSPEVPVHDVYTISIKPGAINDSLKKNLVIARINKNGKKEFVGGEYQAEAVTVKVKEFGSFVVTIDTVAPVIKPINISPGKNISDQKNIELKVSDNFSGIKNFEAFIDGHWILMEYEYKQNKLYYTIDTTKQHSPFDIKSRSHNFKLNVTDGAGNTRTYATTLTK